MLRLLEFLYGYIDKIHAKSISNKKRRDETRLLNRVV